MRRVILALLRLERRRLERAIDRPYDARRSCELDAIVAALEALA